MSRRVSIDTSQDTAGHGDRARYGVTLLLTLTLVVWLMAGTEDSPTAFLVVLVSLGICVIGSVLWMTGNRVRRTLQVAVAAAVVAGVASGLGLGGSGRLEATATIIVALVALVVPLLIVHGMMQRARIDQQMVMGVLTIYLLLGICSAMALGITALLESSPILQSSGAGVDTSFRDRTYFAFTTLTTTGYGDLAPATDASRAVAMVTALVGQLYLVTAVAASVSLVAARPGTPRGARR